MGLYDIVVFVIRYGRTGCYTVKYTETFKTEFCPY